VVCGRQASHLDHIKPIKDGGAFLDQNNVQPLCIHHHGKKTASHDGGFGNPKK
jgi:5-methylcytosine-specific restriction protein A